MYANQGGAIGSFQPNNLGYGGQNMNFQQAPYMQYYGANYSPAPGSPGYIRPGSPRANSILNQFYSIGG
jgi:hypothetical protein